MQSASVINLAAARARRGLPLPAPRLAVPAFALGQPVTVIGRPVRYGWVVLTGLCPRSGAVLYTVQTDAGRVVCRETQLLDGGRAGA